MEHRPTLYTYIFNMYIYFVELKCKFIIHTKIWKYRNMLPYVKHYENIEF